MTGACNATTQAGCFADGGVLGRIPASRLYQPGLNVLKMYPLPTSSSIIGRNLEFVRPAEDTLSYQPAVRFDYQPFAALRVSYKFQGQITRRQVVQGPSLVGTICWIRSRSSPRMRSRSTTT